MNKIVPRAALALVTAIAVAGVVVSSLLAERAAEYRERALAALADDLITVSRVQVAAAEVVASGRGYLITGETDLLTEVSDADRSLEAALSDLEPRPASPSEGALLREVRESARRYLALLNGFLARATSRDEPNRAAGFFREKLLPARNDLEVHIRDLAAETARLRNEGRDSIRRAGSRAFTGIVVIGSVGALLAASLALIGTRGLALLLHGEQDAARRARRSLDTAEDLVGVVARGLYRPLSALAKTATIVQKRAEGQDIRLHADKLRDLTGRVERFVGDLLDAYAIEAGGLSVLREECSVVALVASAVEGSREAADRKQVVVRSQIERVSTLWVDPGRLRQVLSDLLDNAIRLSPEKGTVAIRVADASPNTRFEIRDSGPGLSEVDLPSLFGRYWNGRAGEPNVALGLYIARGVVESHAGTIWAETTPKRGTTIIFEVPTLPPFGAAIRLEPSLAHPGSAPSLV